METIKFTCPHCQAVLKTSQVVAPGQSITCPKCGGEFSSDVIATAKTAVQVAVPADSGTPTMSFSGQGEPPAAAPARTPITRRNDWDDGHKHTVYDGPRRKPRTKRGSGALIWGSIAVLTILILGGSVVGFYIWLSSLFTDKKSQVAQGTPSTEVQPKLLVPPGLLKKNNPAPEAADDGENANEDAAANEPRREPKFPDGTPWVGLGLGNCALEIDGDDLDGKRFRLSDYRGKVVMLDFWADWCVYCRQMYDHEKEMVQRFADKPFALLGVNCDRQKSQAKRAVQSNGLTWRSWWDGHTTGMPICGQWGVSGYPRVYILDHKGVIRFRLDGAPPDPSQLDREIEKLLADAEKERGQGETPIPNKPAEAPKKDTAAPNKAD